MDYEYHKARARTIRETLQHTRDPRMRRYYEDRAAHHEQSALGHAKAEAAVKLVERKCKCSDES